MLRIIEALLLHIQSLHISLEHLAKSIYMYNKCIKRRPTFSLHFINIYIKNVVVNIYIIAVVVK